MDDGATAGLWIRADVGNDGFAFDNMNTRPVTGKSDWTKYSIVLDIPEDATNINFGFLISGKGVLWGDDLQFEIVGEIGEGPEVTDMMKQINLARQNDLNLDFEVQIAGRPIGWGGGGKGYELGSSPDAHRGESCGRIRSIGIPSQPSFGSFTNALSVEKYQGKRIRYSGYLKSDMEPQAWAGMWMRVDSKGKLPRFDNMNGRPVKGKTDWTEYSIVLDVPNDSHNINFGFLISGEGTLWGDDLKIEIIGDIGNGPAVTDMNK
jgi:hypothetical protein